MEYSTSSTKLDYLPAKEVVCTDYSKWMRWFKQTQALAERKKLWMYINETVTTTGGSTAISVDEPELPTIPKVPIRSLNDSDMSWRTTVTMFVASQQTYDKKLAVFAKFEHEKNQFKAYLDRTTPYEIRTRLNKQPSTLKAWFKYIRSKYEPSREELVALLAAEHSQLCAGPKSENRLRWLAKWLDLQDRMITHKHAAREDLKFDFVRTVTRHLDETIAHMARETNSLEEAIKIVERWARSNVRNPKLTVNATLQMTNDEDSSTQEPQPQHQKQKPSKGKRQLSGCSVMTGVPTQHECPNFGACNIINYKKRPAESDMNEMELKKFEFLKAYLRNNLKKCKSIAERFHDPVAIDILRKSGGGQAPDTNDINTKQQSNRSQQRKQVGQLSTKIQ